MHRAVMKPPVNAGLFTPFTGIELVKKIPIFTAPCCTERGYATVSRPSVSLSVCLRRSGMFSHRLEYLEPQRTLAYTFLYF